MNHALIIGGTGMLAKVSIWLAENGYHVSIIGRNPEKMQRILNQNPARLTPILVDYRNTKALEKQLHFVQQQNGSVNLVIAWIHSNGAQVIPCLTECLPQFQSWELFHVNGSSSNLEDIKDKTAVPLHVNYHQILLGFKLESGLSRWLTHDEISDGVITAIRKDKSKHVIGTITPWEKRP